MSLHAAAAVETPAPTSGAVFIAAGISPEARKKRAAAVAGTPTAGPRQGRAKRRTFSTEYMSRPSTLTGLSGGAIGSGVESPACRRDSLSPVPCSSPTQQACAPSRCDRLRSR